MNKFLLINDTRAECHVGPDLVFKMLADGLAARQGDLTTGSRVGEDAARSLLDIPGGTHAILVNGEGTIHHTESRASARSLCAVGQIAAERHSLDAFLVNATISDVDANGLEKLRYFKRIFARDSSTRDYLATHGISADVVPDLAILAVKQRSDSRAGILVSDSTKRLVREDLRRFAREGNLPYRPMQWSRVRKDGVRNWKDLAARFDPLRNVLGRHEAEAYTSALCSAAGLLTGRYHGIVLALATRTPFLAISSNTGKIEALLNDVFGNTERIVQLHDLHPQGLTIPQFGGGELEAIDKFISDAEDRASDMFDQIVRFSRT